MRPLEHKGVTYYPISRAGYGGCAFISALCPQLGRQTACVAEEFRPNPEMTSVFITEDEFLKLRLKGEV